MNILKPTVKIVHETNYEFTRDVFIEPHYLRFKPGITPHNMLDSFNLVITPWPMVWDCPNSATRKKTWFIFVGLMGLEVISNLTISSVSTVTLEANNPLNFIVFPGGYFNLPLSMQHLRHLGIAARKKDRLMGR